MNCPSSASSCSAVYPPVLANPRGEFAASCSTRTNQKAHFLGSRQFPRVIYRPANRTSSRLSRREVIAFAGKQSWDIGRFAKTLFFFNGPPNPLKIVESILSSITASAPTEAPEKMETSDVVLVTGATGGVGRRVVDVLRKKGLPVRVLVRNEEKARKMLGPDVDLIIGDVTKGDTLDPKYFKGIKKVINAVSVIVGPKEGDTPDRQKYSQGIKFFEPEIKGPSPEMVEYLGMQNLINAVKNSVGLSEGKLLFGFKGNLSGKFVWGALDDVVMGGVSESAFQIQPTGSETGEATGLFKGTVSTSNNGGFTSIRTKNFTVPEDLSAYDGVELRVKGDGRRYKLIIRNSYEWDTIGYTASFDTVKGEWQSVKIPFSSLIPVFRARTKLDAPPFDASYITALQLMFSKFEYDGKLNPTFAEGQFELPFSSIKAYINEPITPRFVHVSSAGVTRPERPGLDLSKQPPAVRMNKELGSILTYKLKGEDLIRESGVPYTIVRPCALTEEPAGADLIFEQGDNITGKISREEVALICVAALESPSAVGKTFEVKSTVPFSEPFVIDPSNPPPEKDYEVYFKELKDGITGKEETDASFIAETEYHAVMTCPKARALRMAMREFWDIPKEEDMFYTGQDWVLNILANHKEETRSKLLFIWWRAWHLRNNSIFGDGKDKISVSAKFINNYHNTTVLIKNGITDCDRKGKRKMDAQEDIESKTKEPVKRKNWSKPDQGWIKINTDASFIAETGTAHWGVIARDHDGQPILSAWSPIDRCSTAAEAEVRAALQGLHYAAALNKPTILESDCQFVVDCLSGTVLDRSHACFVVDEAIEVASKLQNLRITKVSRDGNISAHKIAAFSRSVMSTGVLHSSVPNSVWEQVVLDCNPNTVE